MRSIIFFFVTFATAAYAQTLNFSYGEWQKLPTSFREMYVAGAFDTLSTIAVPAQQTTAKHYNDCFVKAKMTTGELAEHLKEFAQTRPDLEHKPASEALVIYLITLCGLPAN